MGLRKIPSCPPQRCIFRTRQQAGHNGLGGTIPPPITDVRTLNGSAAWAADPAAVGADAVVFAGRVAGGAAGSFHLSSQSAAAAAAMATDHPQGKARPVHCEEELYQDPPTTTTQTNYPETSIP